MISAGTLRARAMALASRYDFVIFYALSIALGRGLSIFVLPITSRLVPPAEYARLDVAASIIEICGLIASFAIGDLIFRFATEVDGEAEKKRVASSVLGVGVLCAAFAFLVTQLSLPLLASQLSLQVSETALRAGLASAACIGLIELPLAWLRFRNRSGAYLGFIAIRSITQIMLMIAVLVAGQGPEGVIISNACVDGALTAYLFYRQVKEFGISWSREMMRHALHYSLPIVGGSLAMFGLGSCDRLFLAGAVPAVTLAHYALAGKLAFAAPLLLQPFLLWWNPRRIAILSDPDGIEQSRRMVGLGMMVLSAGSMIVIITGALFLHYVMPASFHGAIRFLPFIIFMCALNEIASLVNVGAFARAHGREVLLINGLGGIAAIAGYALLVPMFGVSGAIVATILGHSVRIVLFIVLGHKSAPVAYPISAMLAMMATIAALVYVRPPIEALGMQIVFAIFALAVVWAVGRLFGIMPSLKGSVSATFGQVPQIETGNAR